MAPIRARDDKPTIELGDIRFAVRPLRRLSGHTPVRQIGPLASKGVRNARIDAGLCRSEINRRVGRIVRAIKWAVGAEIAPPSGHHRTTTAFRPPSPPAGADV